MPRIDGLTQCENAVTKQWSDADDATNMWCPPTVDEVTATPYAGDTSIPLKPQTIHFKK